MVSYLWFWPAGGWDFDAWRSGARWTPVRGPQSGTMEHLPVLGDSGEDWPTTREHLRGLVRQVLGEVTDRAPDRAEWAIVEEHEEADYLRRRIRYALAAEEWGTAWLLTPYASGPRAAAIALHQTLPEGKDEPVGLAGDAELAYGRELAERGLVVLAPDAIGFGERAANSPPALYRSAAAFFSAHPEGSVLGKMCYDLSRAVDLLTQLPAVDAERIGCIGHSHGGYGTLLGMALEPRIRAGVVSCGISSLRSDPTPERWWRGTALMPRLGLYEGGIAGTPWDFHHLLALVAPRPLTVVTALQDRIFPGATATPRLLELARAAYAECGAPEALRGEAFVGPHGFPRKARRASCRWLAEALGEES
jgi:dienelactone hydrolase